MPCPSGCWRWSKLRGIQIKGVVSDNQRVGDVCKEIGHSQSQKYSSASLERTSSVEPNQGIQYYEQKPTKTIEQPIRTRYLGHMTCYQPIRDQYFQSLLWNVGLCNKNVPQNRE
eukprot:sb/3476818/